MFADDLKIFGKIKTIDDCIALQRDLDSLFEWCQRNKLDLSIEKCSIMAFSNKSVPTPCDYNIGGVALKKVEIVKDLGITYDSKLKFDKHIDGMITNCTRTLGFIMRVSKQFDDITCLKTLYMSLVRSKIEYASVIWSQFSSTHTDRIEKVQRKFTRYLYFKMRVPRSEYDTRLSHIELEKLETRRNFSGMSHLYRLSETAMTHS